MPPLPSGSCLEFTLHHQPCPLTASPHHCLFRAKEADTWHQALCWTSVSLSMSASFSSVKKRKRTVKKCTVKKCTVKWANNCFPCLESWPVSLQVSDITKHICVLHLRGMYYRPSYFLQVWFFNTSSLWWVFSSVINHLISERLYSLVYFCILKKFCIHNFFT